MTASSKDHLSRWKRSIWRDCAKSLVIATYKMRTLHSFGCARLPDYTFEDGLRIGERNWKLQRLFNLQAGPIKEDDTIPKRVLEEPAMGSPNAANVYDPVDLKKLLDEYYDLMRWDKEACYPTKEKLTEMGL